MAVFPISGPATRQPRFAPRINLESPLARGLVSWWVPGLPRYDSSTYGIAANRHGAGISTNGTNQYGASPVVPFTPTALCMAFFAEVNWNAPTTFERGVVFGTANSGMSHGIQLIDNGTRSIELVVGDSAGTGAYSRGTIPTGKDTGPHLYACNLTAGSADDVAYIDGIPLTCSRISAGNGTFSAINEAFLYTGRLKYLGTWYYGRHSWIGLAAAWNRHLTAEEHASFADNPWQLFEDPEAAFFFTAAAGGGGAIVNPFSGRGGAAAQPVW